MGYKYDDFKAQMIKIADVNNSIAVLQWDKEVNLPTKGASHRSHQISTLAGISHELFTESGFDDKMESLLSGNGISAEERKNLTLTLKDYKKHQKFTTDFVVRLSKATSASYHAWLKAREANNFDLFKKQLAILLEIKREECEIIGYEDHPYDALLDEFEPGEKTADLVVLFEDVRNQLVAFVDNIRDKKQVNSNFLKNNYPKDKQWNYGLDVLKQMGYDFTAGRQDISPHPFTTNFSSQDVRVTTRVDEHDLSNMIWSCIHEGGHALYEQGLPDNQYGLPLGKYISLGIHESQSRLWENNVGRSLDYWKSNYAKLQKTFPANLGNVELIDFHKAINRVEPNLIRTESDELHYHFHILIRFEIEKGLIEGSLDVNDLRNIWNTRYKEYLEVDVPDDKSGILQDVHWSHGAIGYFPTYSLGSFYAAQFFTQAKKDIPNLIEEIQNGNTESLLKWLNEKVHKHGRMYNAEELCVNITGEKLNFKYFMDYVTEKYGEIYP